MSLFVTLLAPASEIKNARRASEILKARDISSNIRFWADSLFEVEKEEVISSVMIDIIDSIPQEGRFIILFNDNSNRTFFIRKLLFERNIPYMLFSNHFFNKDALMLTSQPPDFGTLFRNYGKILKRTKNINVKSDKFKCRQKIEPSDLIIDVPPEEIIPKHLFKYRNSHRFSCSIIKYTAKNQDFLPVKITGDKVSAEKFLIHLGKRAEFISSESVRQGSVVVTWSTYSFFNWLERGMIPIPVTRTLAEAVFRHSRKLSIGEIIEKTLNNYPYDGIDRLIDFVNEWMTFSEEKNMLFKKLPFIIDKRFEI